ncbi:hypothetical protein [Escherichia phage EP_H11]|nr:hypothetical protein [Escherichia phage EP_H11]
MTHEEFLSKYYRYSNRHPYILVGEEWISAIMANSREPGFTERFYEKFVPRPKCGNEQCSNKVIMVSLSKGWGSCCSVSCRNKTVDKRIKSSIGTSRRMSNVHELENMRVKVYDNERLRRESSDRMTSYLLDCWADPEYRLIRSEISKRVMDELNSNEEFRSKVAKSVSKSGAVTMTRYWSEDLIPKLAKMAYHTQKAIFKDLDFMTVYLVSSEDRIKVGVTSNLNNRTGGYKLLNSRTLGTELAFKLELVIKHSIDFSDLGTRENGWTEWRSKDHMDDITSLFNLPELAIIEMANTILGENND